jgi:hypothetical protein
MILPFHFKFRICSYGRLGSKVAQVGKMSFPIWTGTIHETHRTKNGYYIWKRVGSYGGSRAGRLISPKYLRELRKDPPYLWSDIRIIHNSIVSDKTLSYIRELNNAKSII